MIYLLSSWYLLGVVFFWEEFSHEDDWERVASALTWPLWLVACSFAILASDIKSAWRKWV